MANETDVTGLQNNGAREFAIPGGPAYTRVLLPHSRRGRELQDLLCKEFGIPDKTRWFQIRFAIDEPVTVTCEFMPVTPHES